MTVTSLGKQLCEIFGLDAKRVSSIDIHVRPNDLVTLTCMMVADDDSNAKFVEVLKRYRLTECPPQPSDAVSVDASAASAAYWIASAADEISIGKGATDGEGRAPSPDTS